MDVCPTKDAIEAAFKLISEKTGIDVKQKLSECQLGGKKKGKRRMKGGEISKENIIVGIYLLIGLIIAYFIKNETTKGTLPNEHDIEQILNGDCITVLQNYYPEQQSNSLCSIFKNIGLVIAGARDHHNVYAILFIVVAIYSNSKISSGIMSAIDILADKIYNMQKLNDVTQEEGSGFLAIKNGDPHQTPPPFNLDNINRDLLLEPGRRVTQSIMVPAPVPAPSSFGTYRIPVSNLFAKNRTVPRLPIDEGPSGGKRRGHKTKKGGSKQRMSNKRKHRKRTRRA
jgi:hypothetical protein